MNGTGESVTKTNERGYNDSFPLVVARQYSLYAPVSVVLLGSPGGRTTVVPPSNSSQGSGVKWCFFSPLIQRCALMIVYIVQSFQFFATTHHHADCTRLAPGLPTSGTICAAVVDYFCINTLVIMCFTVLSSAFPHETLGSP